MLRTNTRKVKLAVMSHIRDCCGDDLWSLYNNIIAGADPRDYGLPRKIARYVDCGNFLCYTDSKRQIIKEWLEETDEEASRFTNEQVENEYRHLIVRELTNFYERNKA